MSSWASVTAAPPKVKAVEEASAAAPARTNGFAPSAARPAAAAPALVPATPPAKEPQYEPAPNEIMHITLMKPTADAVLGIRLAGRDRCAGSRPCSEMVLHRTA